MRTTLIVLSAVVASAFVGFIGGFREGSRASLWSEFVLRGVLAGQQLEALEKGNKEFALSMLKGEINNAFLARTELSQLSGYSYLSPLTGVELHGLKSEFSTRLEKYKYLQSSQDGVQ